eukprot:3312496-Heterocapsa_arctica.AAC.1
MPAVGAPHTHVWAEIVKQLIADGTASAQDMETLSMHANAVTSPLQLEDDVHLCIATGRNGK